MFREKWNVEVSCREFAQIVKVIIHDFLCVSDGRWRCPYRLKGMKFECQDGKFYCDCPGNGEEVHFVIACCYAFPV